MEAWEKVKLMSLQSNSGRVKSLEMSLREQPASQKPELFPDTLKSENDKGFLIDSTDVY